MDGTRSNVLGRSPEGRRMMAEQKAEGEVRIPCRGRRVSPSCSQCLSVSSDHRVRLVPRARQTQLSTERSLSCSDYGLAQVHHRQDRSLVLSHAASLPEQDERSVVAYATRRSEPVWPSRGKRGRRYLDIYQYRCRSSLAEV